MSKMSVNILYSFLGEILLFSFSFLLGVITARFLGPAGKGGFWIVYNLAGFLTLIFSMRFRQSITYHLSRNRDQLGEIVRYGLLVGLFTVIGVSIVASVFELALQRTLLKGIGTSWTTIALICLSYYLWSLIVAVLEGLMQFKTKAIFMGSSYLVKCLLASLGLIYMSLTLSDLILLMGSVETIVYFAVVVVMLVKAGRVKMRLRTFRRMFKYSARSFPGAVSDFYTLRVDAFLLNYFAGAADVGIYSVAVSLAAMLLYVPAAVKSVLMPYIARLSDREMTERLSRLLLFAMGSMAVVLTPIVWFGVIPLYGDQFSFSRTLFLILLPGSMSWGLFLLLASDMEGRGLPWRVSKISMMTALSTVVLSVVMIPMWGATGAAVVSSVTQGIAMILAFRVYKRMVGITFAELVVLRMEDLYSIYQAAHRLVLQKCRAAPPALSQSDETIGHP